MFVDVDFSAHTSAEDDDLLEAALQQFEPSQIVLPAFFQPDEGVAGKMVYTRPLERLRRHATLGGVNFRPDSDGLIRSMAATWTFGDTTRAVGGCGARRTGRGTRPAKCRSTTRFRPRRSPTSRTWTCSPAASIRPRCTTRP